MRILNAKEEKLYDFLKNIYAELAASYVINLADKTYETQKADVVFQNLLGDKGSLENAYNILFMQNRTIDRKMNKAYEAFVYDEIFEKRYYSGRIELTVNGVNQGYDFWIMKLADHEGFFFLRENSEAVKSLTLEKMKMDTIQEDYLFSMIVDLNHDSCVNTLITEARSERQDYLDMKYSEWRLMIVNMFLKPDQGMFLEMSEPEYIIEQLEEKKFFKFEIQMMSMQGQLIWVRLMFKRMKGFSREQPVFVYTVQDINEDMIRLLQQENIIAAVQEKNEELKNINQAKNIFISRMSHEIRTPINAVLGFDEMILREAQNEAIQSYAMYIKNAGKMLLSVINDILDFSKIESGKMEIIPVEYNISSLIEDITSMISVRMKEKNLLFQVGVDEKMPAILFGDEIRIKQIIVNILTNAVKYTEKGKVRFWVGFEKQSDDEIKLQVRVADTGIGMKEEDIGRLFNDFERIEEKRNRNIEGTGLGMNIVVKLLEQMGSKLEVSSVYGKGSIFSFAITQKVINHATINEYKEAEKQKPETCNENQYLYAPDAKVLAVDDNLVNLMVMKGLLKRSLIQFDYVQSGKECLDTIQEKDYDLILLDHLMPEMDGIETLHYIRELGGKYESMPVIALTANAMSGAREQYLQAGFHDFLEKPVNIKVMEEMLFRYLPNASFKE